MHRDEYTSQQRASLAVWWIVQGDGLTTQDLAERLSISYQGADKMLKRISRVIPLYRERCDDVKPGDPGRPAEIWRILNVRSNF